MIGGTLNCTMSDLRLPSQPHSTTTGLGWYSFPVLLRTGGGVDPSYILQQYIRQWSPIPVVTGLNEE